MTSSSGGTDDSGQFHQSTILIADDDDGFRETLEIWLSDLPCEVKTASGGRQAVEKLDETVDLLVLDRGMPELAAAGVIEELNESDFECPVVILTAYKPNGHLNPGDVAEYLTKPIQKQEFLDALERQL